MIRLCAELDRRGFYKAADALFKRYVKAQFMQPSNNANSPLSTRMVPWKGPFGDAITQRDKDWFKKNPALVNPDYISFEGEHEPPFWPSEGGTSNLQPNYSKYKNENMIQMLAHMLATQPDLTGAQVNSILKQIESLKKGVKSANGLVGNEFGQQGDGAGGVKNVVLDSYSPSMTGIDSFKWENRRDDPGHPYKNLLPN